MSCKVARNEGVEGLDGEGGEEGGPGACGGSGSAARAEVREACAAGEEGAGARSRVRLGSRRREGAAETRGVEALVREGETQQGADGGDALGEEEAREEVEVRGSGARRAEGAGCGACARNIEACSD